MTLHAMCAMVGKLTETSQLLLLMNSITHHTSLQSRENILMKKTAQLRPAQPGYVKVVVSLSDADASAVKGRSIG